MPNTSNQNNSKVSKSLMNSPYMQNYSENRSRSSAGASLPNSNRGLVPRAKAPMVAYPQPVQARQPKQAMPAPVANPAVAVSARKQKKLMAKQLKGRSDHFYIQRKGATFLMLILSLIIVASMGISLVVPMLGGVVKKPDYTPQDNRLDTEEDGETIPYKDKSVYYSPLDAIMGTLKGFTKKDLYAEAKIKVDEEIAAGKFTEEEKEAKYKKIEIYKSEFYDIVMAKFEEKKITGIMPMIFQYHAAFYALLLLIGLCTIFKCFCSFFGKRVYKRFGLTAILIMIIGVVILFSGFIGVDAIGKNLLNKKEETVDKVEQGIITEDKLNTNDLIIGNENDKINLADEEETTEEKVEEPTVVDELVEYIKGAISPVPATEEDAKGLPVYVSGLLPLLIVGLGIFMLFISLFARRKVNYSIFENIK